MSIQKSIKNSLLTMNGLVAFSTNQPSAYADKQTQYLSADSKTFIQRYAKYANDYMEAQVQGINPTQPYEWQTRMIRMADVVRPSAAILRKADGYKVVLFADREVEYLLPGSKLKTMGSTWLVTNPRNISGADGAGIVERCNATWNYLDYYGNVVSEPMVVSNERADANASDSQEANLITKGYFNVTMQYNPATAQIDTNTRMILGTAAYRVTGYSDFIQELTGDYDTVRILEFTIRFEEPNAEIDDMVNHVASGKTFSWAVQILGGDTVTPDGTLQLTAVSMRNGENVTSTTENPIGYIWTSSDESVATVNENGLVTAVSTGTAVITATLEQNPAYFSEMTIEVATVDDSVQFTSAVPKSITAYKNATITAAFFSGTTETSDPLTWTVAGASNGTYSFDVDGNSVTIYCYGYSKTPLTVTATNGEHSVSADIKLVGI